jgi:glucokinase
MAEAEQPKATLGVDLGGTKILAGLVGADGRILASHRYATAADGGFDGVARSIIAELEDGSDGVGVARAGALGIGVAGQVERGTGVVSFAPNLGWRDAPLGATLEAGLGIPVVVTNDVRAATWGEWKHGAGRGVDDLVVLFIGTGIGGGVIAGGRPLEGTSNTAGELGHMTVVHNGRKCHCNTDGCLEAYAGGWAIGERAREAARADPAAGDALIEHAGAVEEITAGTVTAAAATGDPLANALIDETLDCLASALVGIVNGFNPRTVVLGGGVWEHWKDRIDVVRRIVAARALGAAAEALTIVPAALGNSAGLIGAATLAAATLTEDK